MNIDQLLLYDAKWWIAPKKSHMLSEDNLVKVLKIRRTYGIDALSKGVIIKADANTECLFSLLIREAIK